MRRSKADVIKVGHHGSINASPDWSFTTVMPTKLAGNAAVISTDDDRFTGENEVPKDTVLNGWRGRLKKPVAAAAHGLEESGRVCGGDARGLGVRCAFLMMAPTLSGDRNWAGEMVPAFIWTKPSMAARLP